MSGSSSVDAVRACRERLAKIDVDDVRKWLGYEKINVWGGSYGTVAAQVYLRRHAPHGRAIVLASVAPLMN